MMTVRSNWKIYGVVQGMITAAMVVIQFYGVEGMVNPSEKSNLTWGIIIIFGVLFFLLWIKAFIYWFRVFVFDEEGCTVKLLFIKKKYFWKDLKCKKIAHYRQQHSRLFVGDGLSVAYFSKRKIRKKKSIQPELYNFLSFFGTFSFFFVNFIGEEKNFRARLYNYDGEEFMKKMGEWGVELEEENAENGIF